MPGKGEFVLTGQLGDVMKESAQAGISYIRSVAASMELIRNFSRKMTFTYIFRKVLFQRMVRLPELPWQPPCFLHYWKAGTR